MFVFVFMKLISDWLVLFVTTPSLLNLIVLLEMRQLGLVWIMPVLLFDVVMFDIATLLWSVQVIAGEALSNVAYLMIPFALFCQVIPAHTLFNRCASFDIKVIGLDSVPTAFKVPATVMPAYSWAYITVPGASVRVVPGFT